MIYDFKKTGRIKIKVDAQVAGEVCEDLERNGGLTPKRLVDVSRPEDAPLHNEFEWRDDIAAEAYREQQAAHLIRCLIVKQEEKEAEPVRAFFPLSEDGKYENIQIILSSPKKTATLFEMAIKELKAFERKYAALSQLNNVFKAIDSVCEAEEWSNLEDEACGIAENA